MIGRYIDVEVCKCSYCGRRLCKIYSNGIRVFYKGESSKTIVKYGKHFAHKSCMFTVNNGKNKI